MGFLTKNPDVIFRRVEDGAVLLSAQDEVYFGLNEVGAFIWELLSPDMESSDVIRDALLEKYPDVESDVIATDLAEILDELIKAGMLLEHESAETSS